MALHTNKIQARIDPRLKASAEAIFKQLGMSSTDAIRLFYKQVELHAGLPFPVKISNAKTRAALREAEQPEKLKGYHDRNELFSDLGWRD